MIQKYIKVPEELYCTIRKIIKRVRIRSNSKAKPSINKVIETAIEIATPYKIEQLLYPFTVEIPEGVPIGEMYSDYDSTR